MNEQPRKLVVLAEGSLDFHHGKTATSILRYRPEQVVAVVDSEHAGKSTADVLGIGGDTPIVADVDESFHLNPTALLIGIAPRGGGLPPGWRRQILKAIGRGLDIVSGLHTMLNEDEELSRHAADRGVTLVDVRKPSDDQLVAELNPHRVGSKVVTFVGSDCAVGKMTAALEVTSAARRRGDNAAFVATGQTGILLEGHGVPVDRVIGDFMAGSVEKLVVDASQRADWVYVEGQGSLLHPGYSGVTLALLHGSQPDAMILVHPPARTHIEEYPIPIPPLDRLVTIYEDAAGWIHPARVAAIALNTREMDAAATARAIAEAEQLTGLPCTDPVKFSAELLVDAVHRMLDA